MILRYALVDSFEVNPFVYCYKVRGRERKRVFWVRVSSRALLIVGLALSITIDEVLVVIDKTAIN
jgi:hypothetical protein